MTNLRVGALGASFDLRNNTVDHTGSREIGRPIVHQQPPAIERVSARIGRLHLVGDYVRQCRLDDLARVSV